MIFLLAMSPEHAVDLALCDPAQSVVRQRARVIDVDVVIDVNYVQFDRRTETQGRRLVRSKVCLAVC